MADLSANISAIIQKSAVNAIHSYDLIEDEIKEQLYGGLNLLDVLLSAKSGSKLIKPLQAVVPNCDYLEIYDADGNLIYPPDAIPILNNPRDLLTMSNDQLFSGYWLHPEQRRQLLGVLRNDKHHRLLAAYADADLLLEIRKTIGIGSLINSLAKDSSIEYIAIQDSLGILAATRLIDTLNALVNDPFICKILQTQQFGWRISEFHSKPVFEGILPFNVDSVSYGVIRVGLNYQPLAQIQQAAIRQLILRFGILSAMGFVALVYVMAIQNIRLLEREKAKITREVVRLQADLQQKEKLSAMGELAAGVAHEIRNPLNAISMSVQLLEREATENSSQQQRLVGIRKEITRIQNIIQQFLIFARPAPLQRQRVDVAEIIDRAVQTFQARALSQNVKIIWYHPGQIEANLDPGKIMTCISNLIDNAIDATPAGGQITITLRRRRRNTFFSVADNGIGIPPENLSKIFNLYFTTKPTGTGLGLAQVYQIVSEHGGSIEVKSQPGAGSTFEINLPD
jgi:signal transduction histidine kinase